MSRSSWTDNLKTYFLHNEWFLVKLWPSHLWLVLLTPAHSLKLQQVLGHAHTWQPWLYSQMTGQAELCRAQTETKSQQWDLTDVSAVHSPDTRLCSWAQHQASTQNSSNWPTQLDGLTFNSSLLTELLFIKLIYIMVQSLSEMFVK